MRMIHVLSNFPFRFQRWWLDCLNESNLREKIIILWPCSSFTLIQSSKMTFSIFSKISSSLILIKIDSFVTSTGELSSGFPKNSFCTRLDCLYLGTGSWMFLLGKISLLIQSELTLTCMEV